MSTTNIVSKATANNNNMEEDSSHYKYHKDDYKEEEEIVRKKRNSNPNVYHNITPYKTNNTKSINSKNNNDAFQSKVLGFTSNLMNAALTMHNSMTLRLDDTEKQYLPTTAVAATPRQRLRSASIMANDTTDNNKENTDQNFCNNIQQNTYTNNNNDNDEMKKPPSSTTTTTLITKKNIGNNSNGNNNNKDDKSMTSTTISPNNDINNNKEEEEDTSSLPPEIEMLYLEADLLLENIRHGIAPRILADFSSSASTVNNNGTKDKDVDDDNQGKNYNYYNKDNDDVVSMNECSSMMIGSDDGMRGEIQNLGMAISNLRRDLETESSSSSLIPIKRGVLGVGVGVGKDEDGVLSTMTKSSSIPIGDYDDYDYDDDDDGMKGEIRNLGMVVSSLRHDLENLDIPHGDDESVMSVMTDSSVMFGSTVMMEAAAAGSIDVGGFYIGDGLKEIWSGIMREIKLTMKVLCRIANTDITHANNNNIWDICFPIVRMIIILLIGWLCFYHRQGMVGADGGRSSFLLRNRDVATFNNNDGNVFMNIIEWLLAE